MNYIFSLIVLLFFFVSCQNKQLAQEKVVQETFDCTKGEMTGAWYTMGEYQTAPSIEGLKPEFVILVDTNLRATNFVSFHEAYARERAVEMDTFDLEYNEGWELLTTKQKFELLKKERKAQLLAADSIHKANNKGQQQVWIINNSTDTVSIQMQDWSFICVLQAKTKSGQWYPIEYWRFSKCGNSYYYKDLPPKTANSFITKLPNKGDYETQLRYKLLGVDQFYYSNEFDGTIDYCAFVEDSLSYDRRRGNKPHYKLDSLIKLNFVN